MTVRVILQSFLVLCFTLLSFTRQGFAGEDYKHYSGVLHVHSDVSSGELDFNELVRRAKKWNVRVLLLTDHQRHRVEYGLWPMRNLLKKGRALKSVENIGAAEYIRRIDALQAENPGMVILPGMEVVPYYRVSAGEKTRFRITDFHRHMIVTGLPCAESYDSLPTIHGPASMRFTGGQLLPFIISLAVSGIFLYLFVRRIRKPGALRRIKNRAVISARFLALGVLFVVSVLFVVNYLPFRNTRFTQYEERTPTAAYQDVIDAVNELGGTAYWAHPEVLKPAKAHVVGPAEFVTAPYPGMLLETEGYAAFAGIYGDTITFTRAGWTWDRALLDYCRGARKSPPYVLGEGDYHKPPTRLNLYQTVFLLEDLSRESVLEAMRRGRMYAMRAPRHEELRIGFTAESPDGKTAVMGETLRTGSAVIRIKVDCPRRVPIDVEIIKDGAVLETARDARPGFTRRLRAAAPEKGLSYWRVRVTGAGKDVLTNPIFVGR